MAATADFGAPGPIIDFQAPLSHTLIAENKRRKGAFEKLFLDGRRRSTSASRAAATCSADPR